MLLIHQTQVTAMTELLPATDDYHSSDTGRVAGAFIRFLAGVVWAASGALMAFNPPPPGGRRMHSLPVVGFITLAGGIWIAVRALRGSGIKGSGKPPRHAAKTSPLRPVLFFTGNAAFLALGVAMLREGIVSPAFFHWSVWR